MMNACGATPLDSDCVAEPTAEAPQGTCGSPYAAIPFFVSFQFLGSFVFLNLIVAVRISRPLATLATLSPSYSALAPPHAQTPGPSPNHGS